MFSYYLRALALSVLALSINSSLFSDEPTTAAEARREGAQPSQVLPYPGAPGPIPGAPTVEAPKAVVPFELAQPQVLPYPGAPGPIPGAPAVGAPKAEIPFELAQPSAPGAQPSQVLPYPGAPGPIPGAPTVGVPKAEVPFELAKPQVLPYPGAPGPIPGAPTVEVPKAVAPFELAQPSLPPRIPPRGYYYNEQGKLVPVPPKAEGKRKYGFNPNPFKEIKIGHLVSVNSIVFNPVGKGKTILVGSTELLSDGRQSIAELLDITSGQVVQKLVGHTDGITSVAISSDGKTALTGSWDKTVRLWDLKTGKELRKFTADTPIASVAFNPKGNNLAAGCFFGKKVYLIDWSTGTEVLKTIEEPKEGRTQVAFSPDGEELAIVSDRDTTARLRDAKTGALLKEFKEHTAPLDSVAVSPDGKILATGSTDGKVYVWNIRKGELLHEFKEFKEPVLSLAFNPAVKILAAVSGRRGFYPTTSKALLWDLEKGERLREEIYDRSEIPSVTFSPNGKTLATGSINGTVKLYYISGI